MSSPIVTTSSTLICTHGASVSIVSANTRVKAGGSSVALMSDTYTVSGCPFQIPIGTGTKPQPCVTLQWVAPATRVRVNGTPVIVQSSSAICQSAEQIPQGPPTVVVAELRVKGS